jgi:urea transport system substrate-binding protein
VKIAVKNDRLVALTLVVGVLVLALWFILRGRDLSAEGPIRIAALHQLSGTMGASGRPLVDALRVAVDELNAGGGLLGRRVELTVLDATGDAARTAQIADQLIARQGVKALFACWTSACRKAVKPVVESRRHLMFYPVQYEGLEASPNLVYLGAAPNQQIIPGTHWAMKNFGKRVYLLGSDYVFPRTANRIIADVVRAEGGTIVGERYVALGEREFGAIAGELARLKPEMILNTINGDSNLAFFRQLRSSGLSQLPVLSFSMAEPEIAELGPEAFHPRHFAVWGYFESIAGEDNRRFLKTFKSRFGAGRAVSDPVLSSYLSVLLWAEGVRRAGSVEAAEVNAVLPRLTLPGPFGVTAVDASTRHVWRPFGIGQANREGGFDLVVTPGMALRPVPFPGFRSREAWLELTAQLERSAGQQ